VKPVRVITPWPAGGLTDVAGRIVFQQISQSTGQQFVVDNRPGATGSIGADVVAKSPPDGYTLMVHSASHISNAYTYPKLPYDTFRDFVPIGLLVAQTGLLVTHPSLPVKNVKELIALARAKPGQLLYATSGGGSFSHMAFALLNAMSNTKMLHVPYKGGGPATVALFGGEVSLMFGGNSVAPHIRSGKLRALAMAGRRNPAYPDLPALSEFYPGLEINPWLGLIAPAGVPGPVLARLRAETGKLLADADVRERVRNIGGLDPYATTPQAFAAQIRSEYARYGEVVRKIGVKVD
jgi:tripartite-type tricarboxylate transporter receptor subunit TctC